MTQCSKPSLIKKAGLTLALGTSFAAQALACTGITLTSSDDACVVARTIEWGASKLDSRLIVNGRGLAVQTQTASGPGMQYVGKYGYVGVRIFKDDFIVEGLNEKGLSAGLFFFPGYGLYPDYQEKLRQNTISDMQFVAWMLANFESVRDLKKALPSIRLASIIPQAGTLHYRAADASGEQIVIEVIDGVMQIHDNTLGVLTNSPDFRWQMTNLNNFVHLRTGQIDPTNWGTAKLSAFGVGAGMMGLPGDISPASRFVRAAFMQSSAPELATARDAVVYSFTILNSFEIPIGLELHQRTDRTELVSATQWTSSSDMTNGIFYYKTAVNPRIRSIDLKKIDFSKLKAVHINTPMETVREQPVEELDLSGQIPQTLP